ncbi:MAG: hypothetical protein F2813_04150 [Actinobacteria bacterium]|uniref:Unannotated protein n=1 Tax=freshwater metagenome TaxID=449393 RepID=A0A6J5ZQZ4_9ZZZZ|nr:hypothetical protein [Actinomycetota bacterium]
MASAQQPPWAYGALPCPRCGEWLHAQQDWCLNCGDPARTAIAPSPKWRRPIFALLAVLAVTLGVLAGAFIAVTDDDPPPARTTTQTIVVQPGEALAPGVTPAPTTAPKSPTIVETTTAPQQTAP